LENSAKSVSIEGPCRLLAIIIDGITRNLFNDLPLQGLLYVLLLWLLGVACVEERQVQECWLLGYWKISQKRGGGVERRNGYSG
jgi:hypothetical protein